MVQANLWSSGCYFVTSEHKQKAEAHFCWWYSHSSLHNRGFAEQLAFKLPFCFHTISQNRSFSRKIFRHLEPEKELPDPLSHFSSFQALPPFSSFLKGSPHVQHSAPGFRFKVAFIYQQVSQKLDRNTGSEACSHSVQRILPPPSFQLFLSAVKTWQE